MVYCQNNAENLQDSVTNNYSGLRLSHRNDDPNGAHYGKSEQELPIVPVGSYDTHKHDNYASHIENNSIGIVSASMLKLRYEVENGDNNSMGPRENNRMSAKQELGYVLVRFCLDYLPQRQDDEEGIFDGQVEAHLVATLVGLFGQLACSK